VSLQVVLSSVVNYVTLLQVKTKNVVISITCKLITLILIYIMLSGDICTCS